MKTNYEKALQAAYNNAVDALLKEDLQAISDRSGAALHADGTLETHFLNRKILVKTKGREVYLDDEPAGIRLAILILHYLLQAGGIPLDGRRISFKEVPQGALYFQPFRGRVIFPILRLFDANQDKLIAAVETLGGTKTAEGDLSFLLHPLPRVTVQYIYYRGEEGIPPDLNLLFDATIPEYLSTEDIVVLCEEIHRILKAALS
ncbi:MAG: DUF3786 domain-containing protein [Deltaproteobacteria bacterium]|nr:DUF3786 domain-containing protein [Deltaproteobacteria bacterium]